jgi:dCMP deaminase
MRSLHHGQEERKTKFFSVIVFQHLEEGESLRLDWNNYFIEIAKVISLRSTCIRRKYGAVIVKDNVIISTGYNGAPRGVENCIDLQRCKRKELNVPSGERYELCEAVHAEQNAIINGSPERMKDAVIYIAGFEEEGGFAEGTPCKLCNRMIKNAQIRSIVYLKKDGSIMKEDSFSAL